MKAEILNIGTELLLGGTLNTHHQFLAKSLADMGIDTFYQSTVGDNAERIEEAVKLALSRCDLLITTGGLGPTVDDISKKCVAEALSKKLVYNEKCAEDVKDYFRRMNREMCENNLSQAYFPENSIILKNNHGTAPGCIAEGENGTAIMLPGPPSELVPMWNEQVVPYLESRSGCVLVSKNVNIFGVGESKVDLLLSKFFEMQNPTVAPYAKAGEVLVRITAKAKDKETAEKMIEPVFCEIKEILGNFIYGTDSESLAKVCVDLLNQKGLTVSVAESCTGGLIAKSLTDVPGASSVIHLGAVTYSEEQKIKILGVNPQTIEKYGVVSGETACEMAQGIKKLSNSNISVATTGYAGPGGGDGNNPVGTVYIAVCNGNKTFCKRVLTKREPVDRDYTRIRSCMEALNLIRLSALGEKLD